MRLREVCGTKWSKFGKIPARDFPLNRCYVPRVKRSGTRMQCGRANEVSEEVRRSPPSFMDTLS
jgi:hypothetical protein